MRKGRKPCFVDAHDCRRISVESEMGLAMGDEEPLYNISVSDAFDIDASNARPNISPSPNAESSLTICMGPDFLVAAHLTCTDLSLATMSSAAYISVHWRCSPQWERPT